MKMVNTYNIVVDTREQKPLWRKNIISKKLDVGDYSIEGHEDKITIERKSPGDLYGTLLSGHKRFKKELERAKSYKYFAIIVECSYTSFIDKTFDNSIFCKKPSYILTSILFTIHVKYGINIFFSNGRIETKRIIKEILNAYNKIYIKEYI